MENAGLFRASPLFFCLHLGHILLLEALAWLIIWHWGTSWTLTMLCSVILATVQVTGKWLSGRRSNYAGIKSQKCLFFSRLKLQAGWLQHDFGHLSVFKKSKWNHLLQKFVIGHLKVSSLDDKCIFCRFNAYIQRLFSQGASANWWNHRHFQHHAKPNVFSKDPDVNMLHVFVLGTSQPVEASSKKIFLNLYKTHSPKSVSQHLSVFLSVAVWHKEDQTHALSSPTPVLLSWYVSLKSPQSNCTTF